MSDQPPGIDPDDEHGTLPPSAEAARRILEFIEWFGDGAVVNEGSDMPILYARDLEAVATEVERLESQA